MDSKRSLIAERAGSLGGVPGRWLMTRELRGSKHSRAQEWRDENEHWCADYRERTGTGKIAFFFFGSESGPEVKRQKQAQTRYVHERRRRGPFCKQFSLPLPGPFFPSSVVIQATTMPGVYRKKTTTSPQAPKKTSSSPSSPPARQRPKSATSATPANNSQTDSNFSPPTLWSSSDFSPQPAPHRAMQAQWTRRCQRYLLLRPPQPDRPRLGSGSGRSRARCR